MKRCFTLLLALALNCAYADVTEIDSQNAENCIKQLSLANKNMPIILEYMENCPYYHKFLPVFEKSATEHPKLSYYKVNTDKLSPEVRDKCLGEGSIYAYISPKVTVNVFHYGSPSSILQLRSDIGGMRQPFSEDDLNYLIRNLDDNNDFTFQHSVQVK